MWLMSRLLFFFLILRALRAICGVYSIRTAEATSELTQTNVGYVLVDGETTVELVFSKEAVALVLNGYETYHTWS